MYFLALRVVLCPKPNNINIKVLSKQQNIQRLGSSVFEMLLTQIEMMLSCNYRNREIERGMAEALSNTSVKKAERVEVVVSF